MQRPHKPMGAQTDTPAERRLRSLLRAGGDLADGKDPMEIGEYAFDPAAEKFAELFRDGKARATQFLKLRFDDPLHRKTIAFHAETVAAHDPDEAAKIQAGLAEAGSVT